MGSPPLPHSRRLRRKRRPRRWPIEKKYANAFERALGVGRVVRSMGSIRLLLPLPMTSPTHRPSLPFPLLLPLRLPRRRFPHTPKNQKIIIMRRERRQSVVSWRVVVVAKVTVPVQRSSARPAVALDRPQSSPIPIYPLAVVASDLEEEEETRKGRRRRTTANFSAPPSKTMRNTTPTRTAGPLQEEEEGAGAHHRLWCSPLRPDMHWEGMAHCTPVPPLPLPLPPPPPFHPTCVCRTPRSKKRPIGGLPPPPRLHHRTRLRTS